MNSPLYQIPGYELQRELGVGGMATVYLAMQTSLQRKVAIKVMSRAGADLNFEQRFLIEGRAMAKLPHRNIVGVFDIVQTADLNYIAMEYLAHGTLVERLRSGLSLGEAIAVVVQIADALQLAHDNGIVHRDLKPANIMFRDPATPVLTDFGIAQHQEAQSTRLTQAGMMVGTPTYMSPEQASDQPLDGRSDQYSLGVMFFEMLSGHPPFEGTSPLTVAVAHIQTPPPPLPAQFAQLQPVMDRLLAKKPEQRYADLREFQKDLKRLLAGSATLLARIQSDPNQSASQQLRAIGFTDSGNTQQPRLIPDLLRSGSNASATIAINTQQRTQPGLEPPPRKRGLLLAGVAVLLVALIAVGGWYIFGREKVLDPTLRALVADTLSASDRLAAEGKLVTPPGDNAYEKLQTVLQVAPDLPEALERVAAIQKKLREKAAAELEAGRFDAAQALVAQALAVDPDDLNTLALGQRIAGERVDTEKRQRIDGLLVQAAAAEAAGRSFGEGSDTAFALLRQAQQLDPKHAKVGERLAALTTAALTRARDALVAGQLDEADTQLRAVAVYLAGEPQWQALLGEVEAARTSAQKQEQLATLLATTRAQAKAGRLAEPMGDNAIESLARLRELDAGNAEANALAIEVAGQLADLAKKAEAAGKQSLALAYYDQALAAVPADRGYAERKAALEGQLGARMTQISRNLAAARAAITARRFLEPATQSADAFIEAVLKSDPDNVDARKLRADLPRLIGAAAKAMVAEGKASQATALLAAAGKRYPEDRAIAAQLASVEQGQRAAAAVEERAQRLAGIRQQLAKPKLDAASAGTLATSLNTLLVADPADRDARTYRDTLLRSLRDAIAGATTSDALTALDPVVAAVRKGLPAEAGALALTDTLATRRTVVATLERAALAAISGELVINATPWADVESILDARNAAVTLPKSRSTPLRLILPAGTYRVTLRHPGVREPRVVIAQVEAKKVRTLGAAFPTLTADKFLERAGYVP
ncbi:MAG: protein kinase domain-containing protein [Arenimonas sp.]